MSLPPGVIGQKASPELSEGELVPSTNYFPECGSHAAVAGGGPWQGDGCGRGRAVAGGCTLQHLDLCQVSINKQILSYCFSKVKAEAMSLWSPEHRVRALRGRGSWGLGPGGGAALQTPRSSLQGQPGQSHQKLSGASPPRCFGDGY